MQVDEKKRFRCFAVNGTGNLTSPAVISHATLEEAQVAVENFQIATANLAAKLVVIDLEEEISYWAELATTRPRLNWRSEVEPVDV